MKMRFKRFLSGFMAVATLASVIVQPVTVSASELEPEPTSFEQQYPELQDVQDTLDKDEIVEAKDIEIPYGEEFEVEVDLSGIEGVNEKKVKVLFHEAKSEAGTDFDAHTPDTYKAVYAVDPVSGHPAYRVSRNITVKEPETEEQTKSSSENTVGEGNAGETEDSGNAEEDADSDRAKEIVTDLTDGQEVTTDEESGLTVSEVMDQAENEGIDLYEMEPGETVTFMAAAGNARSSQQVSVTRGAEYRYADYGYGTYLTYQYTVKFGNVSATAYCVQPSKPGPGTGTYTINKVGDGKALAKVCYYGTKASGDDGFFTEENGYGNLSAGARFILVHLAASYANGSSDAFSGANTTAQNLAKKLYNYCISQPDIPDVAMSFSDADVIAYVDGNSQRTKEITFKADELQSITMKLPSGVKLHNVTTGKTSKAGEAVEISGGTKFYLSAPLTQVQDVAGNWSATMKGSVTKDYSAYKISTGSSSQDLALVFGEGVDDEKYVDFKVTWVQYASVKVIKRDAKADAKLAGAVFGLYSDANCTNLITKLPATDANGEASVQIIKTQNTVYLKEITAPTGYRINATAYNVKLEVSKTATVTVPDEEQMGQLTVYKEGQVLTGADVTENGTTFKYEKRRQKADTLLGKAVSGEDGRAVFDVDLPFGTYYIKELAAPAGYVSSFETLEVTAKYQGQDVKVVELESVFKNQPTKVTFTKSDITTGVELSGATLTVLDKDGNVVDTWKSVKGEEHLIERLTAGETYTLREEMAPYGYLMAEEVSFTVDDTAEIQKVEMKDAVPTGTLIINKKGEFLEKVSALDSIGGWMKHLFEYLSGSLKEVTFEVYALEDIKAADGESEDYYKKDALVATITTDETGVAKLTDLPLGKYYVKEKETASGYVLDGETREVDLTYRDQNTAVVTYSADWQNKRQKAEVNVLKKEKDSDRVLEGAVFALCNKEDIVNAKGDVILKANTVIEEQATDKEGKLTFTADLPLGYTYYVKETSPAPGFATTDQVQEFTFEYGGADKETLSYAFTFEDEPTTVEFTKTSLTDGKEIEGAKLKVTDESGNTVDEWTSGKEAHIIKELTAGKKYTMTETLPADGYVTAESITFTVEDTSEVQKVEMKDDVTKVQISKTDISGKELPGAKLTILDKDGKTVESWTSEEKPHYIEMLPIGEYTLREETAPDGYLVAEDVKFTVKDTGEIQKVVMKDEAKPEETPTETPTETPETTPTPETKTTKETKKSTSPKTGDNTPILFWILLAGAGMAGLGGTVILRKKKK